MNIKELNGIAFDRYKELVDSGMFWVWFPEATGIYNTDIELAKQALDREIDNQKEKHMKFQMIDEITGMTYKVAVKNNANCTIKIKAFNDNPQDGGSLKLFDEGYGLSCKFKSNYILTPNSEITLRYDEADYLYKALHVYFNSQNKQEEHQGFDLL